MSTKPETDNPKGKNITINVTDDLRKRVDKLREAHFSGLPINLFTGYLVEVGLEKEELRFKTEEIRNKAILEKAAVIEDTDKSPTGTKQELKKQGKNWKEEIHRLLELMRSYIEDPVWDFNKPYEHYDGKIGYNVLCSAIKAEGIDPKKLLDGTLVKAKMNKGKKTVA